MYYLVMEVVDIESLCSWWRYFDGTLSRAGLRARNWVHIDADIDADFDFDSSIM